VVVTIDWISTPQMMTGRMMTASAAHGRPAPFVQGQTDHHQDFQLPVVKSPWHLFLIFHVSSSKMVYLYPEEY
jgi:hypothetical protein